MITMKLHERFGVSDHLQLNSLFKRLFGENIKDPQYWPFGRRIHRWLMDFPQKKNSSVESVALSLRHDRDWAF